MTDTSGQGDRGTRHTDQSLVPRDVLEGSRGVRGCGGQDTVGWGNASPRPPGVMQSFILGQRKQVPKSQELQLLNNPLQTNRNV